MVPSVPKVVPEAEPAAEIVEEGLVEVNAAFAYVREKADVGIVRIVVPEGCALTTETEKALFVDGLRMLAANMKMDPTLSADQVEQVYLSAYGLDKSVWNTDYSVESEKLSFLSSLGFYTGDFDFPSQEEAGRGGGVDYNEEDCGISREKFLELFGN